MSSTQFETKFIILALLSSALIYWFPGYQKLIFAALAVGCEIFLCQSYYSARNVSKDYWTVLAGAAFCALGYFAPAELLLPTVSIGVFLIIRFGLSIMIAGEKSDMDKIINEMRQNIEADTKKYLSQIESQPKEHLDQAELEDRVLAVKRELTQSCDAKIARQKEAFQEQLRSLRAAKSKSDTELEDLRLKHNQTIAKMENESKRLVEEATVQYQNELKKKNQSIEKLQKENRQQSAEIEALKEENSKILAQQDSFVQKMEMMSLKTNNKMIHNEEIHSYLIKALETAQHEVCIMSPWADKKILDEFMLEKIDRMIRRKVTLKIVYGIENKDKTSKSGRSNKRQNDAEELLRELKKRFSSKYFKTQYFSSHSKLIICDEKFYVITSCNPLSNKGTNWEEIGEVSNNVDNMRKYKERYFNF